jgi:hypothetical protein
MSAAASARARRHVPLSVDLQQLLARETAAGGQSINDLLFQTKGRGLYLVIILICLPFITPIPLPGLSSVVGAALIWLALRLAWDLPPTLPRFLGERRLPAQTWHRVLQASLGMLRWLEKIARPRGRLWITLRPARLANALILTYLGVLLLIPFPPLVLFTNSLPSYAVILIAASMMEEDGVLIWFGYAAAVLSTAYFALLFVGGFALVARYAQDILAYLRHLL